MKNGNKKVKSNKKRKLKYKNIIFFVILLIIILITLFYISNIKLENIYISGNNILSDQQIIDLASLNGYPKIITINKDKIGNKLKESEYIENTSIKYKNLKKEIYIEIEENKPILFYEYEQKYILSDGSRIDEKYDLPTLINQTPEDKLKKLLSMLYGLKPEVLERISEIRYYPSNVDSDLFYLTMSDGNLVYINFNSFDKLDSYIEMIKSFDNKKGILHLDSGNYLEIYK